MVENEEDEIFAAAYHEMWTSTSAKEFVDGKKTFANPEKGVPIPQGMAGFVSKGVIAERERWKRAFGERLSRYRSHRFIPKSHLGYANKERVSVKSCLTHLERMLSPTLLRSYLSAVETGFTDSCVFSLLQYDRRKWGRKEKEMTGTAAPAWGWLHVCGGMRNGWSLHCFEGGIFVSHVCVCVI
jgi:hypothetical protein